MAIPSDGLMVEYNGVAAEARRSLPMHEAEICRTLSEFREAEGRAFFEILGVADGAFDVRLLNALWEELDSKNALVSLARYGFCKALAEIEANAT